MAQIVTKTLKKAFGAVGYDVRRAGQEPWQIDERFVKAYKDLEGRSLVAPDRLYMIWQLSQHAANLEGDFAELGVYQGGTARLVSRVCPNKTLHLFDTFEGMPDVDADKDVHKTGDFNDTSLEGVQKFLADAKKVEYHQGFFPGTAAGLEDRRFSYAYIDADIYQSTKDALEFFYPRMVQGGVMIFDDYNWPDCPGVRQALEEYLVDKRERPIASAKHQCVLFKL